MILGAVLVLVATRRVGRFHVAIWQAMAAGAAAVLTDGADRFADALGRSTRT